MLRKGFCILAAAIVMAASAPVFSMSAAKAAEERQIDISAAALEEGILSITEPGTYRLSGTMDGQIYIDVGKENKVTLILAGVTVTGSGAALYVASADKVILETEADTENVLRTTASENKTGDTEESTSAAVHVKSDLTIRGSGTLTIDGGQRQGIRVTKDLTVKEGTLNVNAESTGIRVKDKCVIKGGAVNVTAGGNGFQIGTEATDTEPADGSMELQDGSVTVTCDGDAVQCAGDILISGGSITAVTGGGQTSASQKQEQDGWGYGWGWDMDWDSDESDGSASSKGLKADGSIEITAGTLDLDCCDDALHSSSALSIRGGNITISSGDDGIHADDQIEISGGDITILSSYEGIEAHQITVSGGSIALIADDDGFNANGGSSSYGSQFGGHGSFGGKHGYGPWDDPSDGNDTSDTAETPSLIISGGTVLVNAEGDGLDSNGNILISGGYTIVDGPSTSMNGALDSGAENGGTLTVTGGTLLAIGAAGMAEAFGEESTQASFLYYCSWDGGDTITISGSDGLPLITHTAVRSGSSIVFTCPQMTQGDTVTILCGSVSGTLKLTGISTAGGADSESDYDSWSWWGW